MCQRFQKFAKQIGEISLFSPTLHTFCTLLCFFLFFTLVRQLCTFLTYETCRCGASGQCGSLFVYDPKIVIIFVIYYFVRCLLKEENTPSAMNTRSFPQEVNCIGELLFLVHCIPHSFTRCGTIFMGRSMVGKVVKITVISFLQCTDLLIMVLWLFHRRFYGKNWQLGLPANKPVK
jgi:hypothetical protein